MATEEPRARPIADLPDALEREDELCARLAGRRLLLCLDFDGTLSPIVDEPADAGLADGNGARLEALASRATVAVISGRDLADVRTRVGVEGVYYAGSHGWDLSGPGGWRHEHPAGRRFQPVLGEAAAEVRAALAGFSGVRIEQKRFALAVHDRLVPEDDLPAIDRAVRDVARRHRDALRMTVGKRLHELRPAVDWDKGRATLWLLETLDFDPSGAVVLFIGDDTTDEDAFAALRRTASGAGIVVGGDGRPSLAEYRLTDVDSVSRFLDRLAGWLEESST